MEKNAITVLQEFSQQNNSFLPKYDIIDEKNGTHLNYFTIRVVCGSHKAEATANSKKAAKLKVAETMIEELKKFGYNFTQYKKNDMKFFIDVGNRNHVNDDDKLINSIGILQEFCAQNKLISPEYEFTSVNLSGEFTCICKLGQYKTKATYHVKKIAKQLSAQKMLNVVNGKTSNINNLKVNDAEITFNIEELKIDDKIDRNSINKNAKYTYAKLKNQQSVYGNSDNTVPIDIYHTNLKNTTNSLVMTNLEFLLNSINLEALKQNSCKIEEVLNKICGMLQVKLNEFVIPTNSRDIYSIFITVSTNPVISEVGLGKQFSEAKTNCLINILESIKVLLN